MKVIDLLNKIAKEKKYPKIKFNDSIYEYHDKEHGYCRYYHDNTYICLNTEYYLFDILNDEIEILEEPKGIPEKIKLTNGAINYYQLPKTTLEEQKMILDYITNLQTIEREYSSLLSENAELQQENDRLNNIINGLKEEIEIYIDITIDHLETNNEEINFELRNKCRAMREIKDDILNIIKKLKESNNE